MIGVAIKYAAISGLRSVKLFSTTVSNGFLATQDGKIFNTHILLLLVNMANLEPDIFLGEWTRRVSYNIFETLQLMVRYAKGNRVVAGTGGFNSDLQTLAKFLLLLVYDPQAKVDLICFFEIWCHAHDLRESLLCMIQ